MLHGFINSKVIMKDSVKRTKTYQVAKHTVKDSVAKVTDSDVYKNTVSSKPVKQAKSQTIKALKLVLSKLDK